MRSPRRPYLCLIGCLAWSLAAGLTCAHAGPPSYPDVRSDERFAFPRDHGAHPAYRTEWWYVTGWLRTRGGEELGFQVTFFRSHLPIDDSNPSRFTPRQLLFAHAALADAKVGHLLFDQRIAREGFNLAQASSRDADIAIDGWRLVRVPSRPEGAAAAAASPDPAHRTAAYPAPDALHFRTRVTSERFAFDLDLRATGTVLAQGADALAPGYSRKGPQARDASRYYSVPQLAVTGSIIRASNRGSKKEHTEVTGSAWLDREWSSTYLDPHAVGWDWAGLNLDDGGALMAFQMRDRQGGKLWAGGARRFADGRVERYAPDDVRFTTLRSWKSPASGATWPVMQRIAIGPRAGVSRSGPVPATEAGDRAAAISPFTVVVEPLMDNQELDSRASTGTIYWEGAVRVYGDMAARTMRTRIGSGYLELTGYGEPIGFGFR